jgi:hypothetical protein
MAGILFVDGQGSSFLCVVNSTALAATKLGTMIEIWKPGATCCTHISPVG